MVTVEQALALDRQIHALVDALPQHDPEVALPDGTQRVIVQLQVMPTVPRAAS